MGSAGDLPPPLRYDETLADEPVTAREMIIETNSPRPGFPDQKDRQ